MDDILMYDDGLPSADLAVERWRFRAHGYCTKPQICDLSDEDYDCCCGCQWLERFDDFYGQL